MGNIDNAARGESNSYQKRVKADREKPIKVNPEYVPVSVRYKPLPSDTKKFRCCMCGNEWTSQKNNFLSGGKSPLWKGNGGYLPFCKSCCESLMENLTSFYGGNEEHALRHICHIFDWYYDDAASAMTLAQVHYGNSRANLYPSKACTRQVAQRGETFLDTIRDEAEAAQIVKGSDDIEDDSSQQEFIVTKEMLRRWSTGMKADEYEFLEREYDDWQHKVEVTSKAQEELIKAICFSQLNVRRAQASGVSKAITDAMKSLTDLMTSCNLTPRQTSEIANSSAAQLSLGQLIKRIEDEEPISEPSDEFKDPDGIRKYLGTFFFGHLAKALHIKNDYQKAYDEEMAKYTVVPPEDGSSSEAIVDLLDQSAEEGEDHEEE